MIQRLLLKGAAYLRRVTAFAQPGAAAVCASIACTALACGLLFFCSACTASTANVGELTPEQVQNEHGWRYFIASQITLAAVESLSLTESDGRAVIAWREAGLAADGVNSRLRVVSAVDAAGTEWSEGRSAWASFSPAPYASDLALATIGGLPAICFYRVDPAGQANELMYLPALDADGFAWGPAAAVTESGRAQQGCALLEVDSQPALLFLTTAGSGHSVEYLRRESEAGGFGSPLELFSGQGQELREPSLALISGNPAICFSGEHDSVANGSPVVRRNLSYRRALDRQGSDWSPSVILDLNPGAGEFARLAQIGPRPAVYYRVEPAEPAPYNPYEMRYITALDASGFSWTTPRFLGIGNGCDIVDVGGQAFASNVVIPEQSQLGGQPYLTGRLSGDSSGEDWSESVLLGYSDRPTVHDLAVVDGRPALVYLEEGRLMFASFHF